MEECGHLLLAKCWTFSGHRMQARENIISFIPWNLISVSWAGLDNLLENQKMEIIYNLKDRELFSRRH